MTGDLLSEPQQVPHPAVNLQCNIVVDDPGSESIRRGLRPALERCQQLSQHLGMAKGIRQVDSSVAITINVQHTGRFVCSKHVAHNIATATGRSAVQDAGT